MTKSGKKCASWYDEREQIHAYKPRDASAEKDHNFCRSPIFGDETPWCYTSESWEECQISFCQNKSPQEAEFMAAQEGHVIIVTVFLHIQ